MKIKRAVFGQAVWINGRAINTIGEGEKVDMQWDEVKQWLVLSGKNHKLYVFPTNISYLAVDHEVDAVSKGSPEGTSKAPQGTGTVSTRRTISRAKSSGT
jgi:hypothetical protein